MIRLVAAMTELARGKRRLLFLLFALFLLVPVAVSAEESTPAVADSSVAASADSSVAGNGQPADTVQSEDDGWTWKSFFSWPFEHIVQPALNGIVYPIAQPLRYAFDNGVIEKAIELITFGEKKNVLLYPIMNLKPGNSTMLGFAYRHRSILFNKDYLVIAPEYYANGDWFFDFRYNKHELFGTRFFGGFRFRKYWDRDASFIIPGSKESFTMPDSSTTVNLRLGLPLTDDGRWSLELSGSMEFVDRSLPDVSRDSILIDYSYWLEERGLYQSFKQIPLEVTLMFDNLDYPYVPSRGSRFELSARYVFVGKYCGLPFSALLPSLEDVDGGFEDSGRRHDYVRTDLMFQHYFYFGKAERFHFTQKEARQNRRFYTDFNWDAALRMWRPDNVRNTLFERRVIGFQFRMIDIWDINGDDTPFDAYPVIGPRFPLRGYSDSWSAAHVMSLSMEYRWPIDYYVDGVLFNEYMMHAPTIKDWSLDHLYNSWGIGVRVRKPDMYWFRVQLGFHGCHGVALVMTIAPEFR